MDCYSLIYVLIFLWTWSQNAELQGGARYMSIIKKDQSVTYGTFTHPHFTCIIAIYLTLIIYILFFAYFSL